MGCYDQLCCPASPKLLLGLDLGLGCDNERFYVQIVVFKKTIYQGTGTVYETWRVPLCRELLDLRSEDMLLPGFSIEEQEDMLAYVCSS